MNTVNAIETNQYLNFQLGQEVFGTHVRHVKEILELQPITRVPRMPDCLLGVINVRGSVVSVIDLRLKLGMPVSDNTRETCIIVMDISLDGSETLIGVLVDRVLAVIELDSESIVPPPRIGTGIDADFLAGMGKRDQQFVMILDAQKVFTEYSNE